MASSVADNRLVQKRSEVRTDREITAHQLRAVNCDQVFLGIDQDI
jgi:hypothetical protein